MATLLKRMEDVWQQAARRYALRKERREHNENVLIQKGDYTSIEDPERMLKRMQLKGNTATMSRRMVDEAKDNPANSYLFLERILEDNELQGVRFLLDGARLARSVCRIVIRSSSGTILGYGTGSLISPRLLMTNNHVLDSAATAAESTAQFDYYEARNGMPPVVSEFALEPGVFFRTNENLDVTIVAVAELSTSGDQLRKRGWNPLIAESGKALIGEPVNIIQHPGGQPQQVALRENNIIDSLDNFLHYRADTKRGSSGSPVSNDQWDLVALHHSSVPNRDDRDRILMRNGFPWDGRRETVDQIWWVANEGVRISRIVAHFEAMSMSRVEFALFKAAFQHPAPSAETASDAVAALSKGAAGQAMVDEEDGSKSWYFRLNFGPVGPSGDSSFFSPSPSSAPNVTVSSSRDLSTNDTDGPKPFESLAWDFFERASRIERPYYDAACDQVAREAYYADVWDDLAKLDSDRESIDSRALFVKLGKLIEDDHVDLGYTKARWEHLYPWVDLHEDGTLRNIYSGLKLDPVEVIREELERLELAKPDMVRELAGMGAESLEAFFKEMDEDALVEDLESQDPFNCEHVVPQSWFKKKEPMKADLHHLFACDPGCNSFRSNIPYFDFDPLEETERGDCGRRVGKKFEPERGHGVVARATLYFLLRYPGRIKNSNSEMPVERLKDILRWHSFYKVSRYELHRNAAIAEAQGNRNPFIDFPRLAEILPLELGFGG
jgi:endonuclease I/V8-like Glu-specific endopeptidase